MDGRLVLLAVLLVAIPILEVWLLVQVGQQLGLLPTVLILVVVAVIGVLLMRHEGARAWKALNDAFTKGKVPTGELADAALILVGGVLLMLPGFLTDIIGFLFLLRWTRPFARKMIAFFVARRINRLGIPVTRARLDRDNLIEGETVESTSTSPPWPGRAGHHRGRDRGGRHQGRARNRGPRSDLRAEARSVGQRARKRGRPRFESGLSTSPAGRTRATPNPCRRTEDLRGLLGTGAP